MIKIKKYLEEIEKKFRTEHAREHAYRPALETLIEDISPSINAVNDPKQQKVGAPDFVLFKGKVSIGYVEAKDVDVDLDREIKNKNQVNRYKASLNNFCFTNYLEFRFYLNGEETERIKVAEIQGKEIRVFSEKFELLESLLKNFTTQKSISIRSPRELAKLMAEKAKMLKNTIYLSLKNEEIEEGEVEKQYEVFKQILIHDLSKEQFADIYAQTVAYGMFAARYHDSTMENFTRSEANELLPKSNPFLRNFFQSIAGYNIDERIVWMVDDLAELFNHVNVRELLENYGKETKRDDAIVHFYETFLGEFDAKLRKSRGVYYTPEPVVDFIVRAVDDILKDEFNIKDGLADTEKIEVLQKEVGKKNRKRVKEHRVQILDPATGTGTFLDHTIKHIYNSKFKGQEGVWQSYVDEHLLPRLHGFEILMASYAMAHLKLDITLSETGYDFKKGEGKRLGVYLTNSLEEPKRLNRDLFSQWLSTESVEANKVKKEKPIMVVMGNPPYNRNSSNSGEFITKLLKGYKENLNERNLVPLDDDYIKFLRYSQFLIEKNGEGIIAMITNNSFLEGVTHREMRKSLINSFDSIYIINLHGNTKKKIQGHKEDENVFDIQQGVSINLFIKRNGTQKRVKYYDLFGRRDFKQKFLLEKSLRGVEYINVDIEDPRSPWGEFSNDSTLYKKFFSLKRIFKSSSPCIRTHNDKELVGFDSYGTKFSREYLFKPFDLRYVNFDLDLIGRSRIKVNQHVLDRENLSIIFQRGCPSDLPHTPFISKSLVDQGGVRPGSTSTATFAPLYLYSGDENNLLDQERITNINPNIIENLIAKLGLNFVRDHNHPDADKKGTFNPLDVLDYIYAILHSPTYRERYKEFLKIDFPRVPFTSDKKLFWKLVEKGRELREYHLMEHEKSNKLITEFPVSGSNEVSNKLTKTDPGFKLTDKEKELGRVWINEEQYFDKVPKLAWEFYIGGYQPAQKWLKDRRDRKLTYEDIEHYQKIIVALVNTDRIMKEIDKEVDKWPIK